MVLGFSEYNKSNESNLGCKPFSIEKEDPGCLVSAGKEISAERLTGCQMGVQQPVWGDGRKPPQKTYENFSDVQVEQSNRQPGVSYNNINEINGDSSGTFCDMFEPSIIPLDIRNCAGVSPLDSSLPPYSIRLPGCNIYNKETENKPYVHPENDCGNI